jgi:hypothetical protein
MLESWEKFLTGLFLFSASAVMLALAWCLFTGRISDG